jgi:hypothetical protein
LSVSVGRRGEGAGVDVGAPELAGEAVQYAARLHRDLVDGSNREKKPTVSGTVVEGWRMARNVSKRRRLGRNLAERRRVARNSSLPVPFSKPC